LFWIYFAGASVVLVDALSPCDLDDEMIALDTIPLTRLIFAFLWLSLGVLLYDDFLYSLFSFFVYSVYFPVFL
jgi:hypothetical protein